MYIILLARIVLPCINQFQFVLRIQIIGKPEFREFVQYDLPGAIDFVRKSNGIRCWPTSDGQSQISEIAEMRIAVNTQFLVKTTVKNLGFPTLAAVTEGIGKVVFFCTGIGEIRVGSADIAQLFK